MRAPSWLLPTALAALAACGYRTLDLNPRPGFLAGDVVVRSYDGATDDLLTAGLGKTGLGGAAPAFADPANPTPAELRRNAIYVNYRALIDFTAAGGYGLLYGPNVDVNGAATLGEGKIPGAEYEAYADDGSGRQNVTLLVQVPASFSPASPCIVTATSSGSRGIYGAIGTAGDWGLKHGCAVAYTDKGTGNGLHDLTTDKVNRQDGAFVAASAAGAGALFRSALSDADRAALVAAAPNRVAYKHAHSQQNPERDWGKNTLQAVKFAYWVLNQRFPIDPAAAGPVQLRIRPDNTIVIASSVSNGAGAALLAAEQDGEGLISGVAVAEPQIQPGAAAGLTIQAGSTPVATFGKGLADYFTHANLYQPCAALSAAASLGSMSAAFWPAAFTAAAQARCAALHARGLLAATVLADQADEALAQLHGYGWHAGNDFLQPSHFRFATNSIAVTYVNAHGRFGPADRVCGYTFANTDATGAVVPQAANTQAAIFATGNGVPPTSGVNVVYDPSVGGPRLDFLATSPTSGQADFALDGALCLRSLVVGKDAATGAPLSAPMQAWSDRVRAGIAEVQAAARLRGKPAIVVAGRNDTLVPPNHAARAYVGAALLRDGAAAPLRYYEVTNAQHFDTFISFGALLGYDTRFVPLHRYFIQAMDLMWAHLRGGAPLPPSQVVRTTPRAPGTAIAPANVPPIAAAPAAADLVTFGAGVLAIPD